MRLKDLFRTEEVAVQFITKVGELRHATRGEDGAEGNALSPKFIIKAPVPQPYPVARVAGPFFGPERRPNIEVAVNYRKESGAHLTQKPKRSFDDVRLPEVFAHRTNPDAFRSINEASDPQSP